MRGLGGILAAGALWAGCGVAQPEVTIAVADGTDARVTADGRSRIALTLTGTQDGALAADGTEIPLVSSLGALEAPDEGAIAFVDGVARVDLVAGTWPGVASLSAEGWTVSGLTEIALSQGEVIGTQLHIHGSLSEGNSTMTHLTELAEEWNTDLLWWTDHDLGYHADGAGELLGFDFETGSLRETTRIYAGTPCHVSWDLWDQELDSHESAVVAAAAHSGDFGWRLTGAGGAEGARARYVLEAHPDINYKPLLAELTFGVSIRPRGDAGLILRMPLSASQASGDNRIDDHDQLVLYHLDAAPAPEPHVSYLPIEAPDDEWTRIELDLSEVIPQRFPELDLDQHVEFLDVELIGGPDRSVAYDLDAFSWPQAIHGEALMDAQRAWLDGLGSPVTQLVGQEISGFGVDHLNAYGSEIPLLRYLELDDGWGLAETADHVHAHGGILAMNHPFTTSGQLFDADERAERVADRAAELIANDAYGCDLLEVGYRQRGGAIGDFLSLWDALSGAGIWITGIGVSDTHNREPPDAKPNNFVTWVASASDDEAELIWNLDRGAAWFGDPTLFPGNEVVATWTAPDHQATMGQVIAVEGETALQFSADWLGAGWRVQLLVSGQIGGAEQALDGRQTTAEGPFSARFEIDADRATAAGPAAARIAVYTDSGQDALYTNPIYLLPAGDDREIPPERTPSP